jgi:hypothetical protein
LDLDHLTSLRRTLLTAIERYDTRTKELIDRELSSGMKSLDCDPIHPDADATDDDETGNERGKIPPKKKKIFPASGRFNLRDFSDIWALITR